MLKLSSITLLLNCLFGFSYAQPGEKAFLNEIDSSNVKEIRIDPRQALAEELKASDVFKSIKYLPLETKNESIFGRIDQLEITKDYFIILDEVHERVNGRGKSEILLFTKDGKFKSKLKGFRTGYFTVNEAEKRITVRDYDSKDLFFHFDFSGKLLKKEKEPFFSPSVFYLNENLIAHYRHYRKPQKHESFLANKDLETKNLILTDKDFNIKASYFPFDTTTIGDELLFGTVINFSGNTGQVYFTQGYDHSIYRFDKTKLIRDYKFVFPLQYTLPPDFLTNKALFEKRIDYLRNRQTLVNSIANVFKAGDLLTFHLKLPSIPEHVYLYKFDTDKLIAFNNIKTDDRSFHLPLGEYIHGTDGKFFYSSVNAKALYENKEKLEKILYKTKEEAAAKKFKGVLPSAMQQYLAKGGERNNPVLILLEPKQ